MHVRVEFSDLSVERSADRDVWKPANSHVFLRWQQLRAWDEMRESYDLPIVWFEVRLVEAKKIIRERPHAVGPFAKVKISPCFHCRIKDAVVPGEEGNDP